MPRSKKKKTEDKSVGKSPSSKATDRDRKGKRTGFIIASVVTVLILVLLGGGYYQSYVAPFQRTIITVDDTSIRMDYFLKRTRLAGAGPMPMLEMLTNEQLIKLGAPRYGIEVSPEDIIWELRRIAQGENQTISEGEFKEWYRQRLNESGLSDSEYKEITRASLLYTRLYEYLAERMPTVAEQVHLQGILVETSNEAEKLRARWEAGENFADLAKEASLDEESKEKGGDLGWFPRGVLNFNLEEAAFSLSTGNVSEPIPLTSETTTAEGETTTAITGYHLLMVSEKDDAREVNEEYLPTLKSQLVDNWLSEEYQFHEMSYNFNSEINAWINWQLAKDNPTTDTTSTQ